jgi:hypothetical protein
VSRIQIGLSAILCLIPLFLQARFPLQRWSLVKERSNNEYDREVIYEEIKAVLQQSLDDVGAKLEVFIKLNRNSAAG